MINIKINKKYKSINPCEFELPDFSVITGLNGSGKTHLLEIISNHTTGEVYLNGKKLDLNKVLYIPFNGLNPNINESCNPDKIKNEIKNFYLAFKQAISRLQSYPKPTVQQIRPLLRTDQQKNIAEAILPRISKDFHTITEDDISDNFDISLIQNSDFFTGQFALIFKNYHRILEENNLNEFYKGKGYKDTPPYLSDDEFQKKYGIPPWEFVNDILTTTHLPYQVNSPLGTRIDSNFELKLIDGVTGNEIKPSGLSTGEKVLMSLALAIYNTSGDNTKPDLLLIDEPDAALHPSMSKKMISVLKEKIVDMARVPVIITSHSPTTVISTDGISIYQMERGNSVPQKISAQKAVEILSSDIPFLKISTEDRRQVFVESKYDVIYYELLTNILAKLCDLNSNPVYIPARTSNGSNCEDVINIVENLFKNGNDQIYGIVDWDLNSKRENRERIIILGNKNRYAVENYLLDPLLMGLFFIREAKLDFNYFGVSSFSSYSQSINLSPSAAQSIIDKILNDLGLFSSNKIKYRLQNGWELEVTKEFCEHQGHALEELYKIKFPFLNSYQREDGLKKDVISKIINDLPEYTPIDIFETILEIK